MSCMEGGRFVELLEGAGVGNATEPKATPRRGCGRCQESWARLAGADGLLRALPPPTRRRRAVMPVAAAAAAVLLVIGIAVWKPDGKVSSRRPAGRQDSIYKP